MTTNDNIYGMPNIGCLLGMAYQAEVARLGAALAAAGLDVSPAEYVIMRILFARGEMQQCEISRLIGKDKASVSRSIRSLERKGYVVASQVSYKCSMASLSERGAELKPRILEIAEALQGKLAGKIPAHRLDDLREMLETIIR